MTERTFDVLLEGRVEAFHLTPETGLGVLTVWTPEGPRRLCVGLGPKLVGVGWAPGTPSYSVDVRHPVVAAARAHLVGARVHAVAEDDDGAVWVSVGAEGITARVRFFAGVSGEIRVLGPSGEVVIAWRAQTQRAPWVAAPEGTLEEVGTELLRLSDSLAAELRRAAILKGLGGQCRRLVRRAEAVRQDLARIGDTGRLQRIGRMLLAQGAKIPRGAVRWLLEDWEEGGELEVALDPARGAKSQAEGFFTEARRISRGEGLMRARLKSTEDGLAALRALEEQILGSETVDPESIKRWSAACEALGVPKIAGPRVKQGQAPRQPYIEYLVSGGQRVLVGRGARDNDTLTLKVARPHDLWMHARGVPGAHVVVVLTKGAQCAPEALVDAATLAAHHSDARGEALVEVTWSEKRYLRKPRKTPAGKVVLDREKVMGLRVEPARLARLLAARKEG